MRKISIDKSDQYRVLLTEVLPYETPFFFSNEGFYFFCRNQLDSSPEIIKKLVAGWINKDCAKEPKELNTVPYNYEIRKNNLETRTLSLMHPAIQLQFVIFYKKFSYVILHLCQRSRFSLRFPAVVASEFYSNHDLCDEDIQYCSTYFEYEKYSFFYNFFHSYEFFQLEKRFRHLRIFDISKCFHHIYTHSISWAVRSREFAKTELGKRTFDGDFDALMQAANFKETAGILVGPEVSRIFAEIILQRVDAKVERRAAESNWKLGINYDVRRYVDDYFIFSSNQEIGNKVMQIYLEELKVFRLYLNEAKSSEVVIPFMTTISCAKVELSVILDDFFASLISLNGNRKIEVNEQLLISRNVDVKARSLIQKIKATVKKHNVEFSSVSGFLFAVIEKQLKKILRSMPEMHREENTGIGGLLHAILDIVFFIYAMDVRVSTTYKVTRIAIKVIKAVENMAYHIIEKIKKKVYDESIRILQTELMQQPELYMETLNLLAIMRVLGPEYRVEQENIDKMISIMDRNVFSDGLRIDYFLVVGIIFYIGDDNIYNTQKSRLQDKILGRFKSAKDPFSRTDFTCLFLDLMSCPFLTVEFKKELVNSVKLKEGSNYRDLSDNEKRDTRNSLINYQWFTNWNARDDIQVLMEKKRYNAPY